LPDIGVAEIKAGIRDRLLTVPDLEKVFTTEPTSINDAPCVTMFTDGFTRRAIESPYIEGQKVLDPIGARTWLWAITCRLWIDFLGDVGAAQVKGDALVKQVVVAYEQDVSLGGIAVDSVISSGTFAKVTPNNASEARSLLMCEMAVLVEITEGLEP